MTGRVAALKLLVGVDGRPTRPGPQFPQTPKGPLHSRAEATDRHAGQPGCWGLSLSARRMSASY